MNDQSKNWNLGQKEGAGIRKEIEKAVMVGVVLPGQTELQTNEYLDELEFLAQTAGAQVVKRVIQKLPHPENRTFIGSGKVEEIRLYIENHTDVNLVIFDDDLSGKQTNNLEELLKVKIIDRSAMILDIFAERAKTAQAKTQVELAQLQYLLPRLRGLWTHLERQRGGIGMRGPGEKEIETDKRIVEEKIGLLKKDLQIIDRQNATQRKQRGTQIRVALVGYTNAGKSTLMTAISKAEVFAENKLFATLDTTVRKVVFGTMPFLLSDTVGFIRKLPHHLIESFKSTLDETRESDILIHVVDLANPQYEDQIRTVNETLRDLGVIEKPTIMVLNKFDLYRERYYDDLLDAATKNEIETELKENLGHKYGHELVFISAKTKEGLEDLKEMMTRMIKEQYVVRYPHETPQW